MGICTKEIHHQKKKKTPKFSCFSIEKKIKNSTCKYLKNSLTTSEKIFFIVIYCCQMSMGGGKKDYHRKEKSFDIPEKICMPF